MLIVWKGDSAGTDVSTPYSLSVEGAVPPTFGNPNRTQIGTRAPGKLFVVITNGNAELDIFSNAVLPISTFTHVAVTADGSTVSLYINGVLDTQTPQVTSTFTSTHPLQIGGISGDTDNFDGVIDELQIWNRALAASEIQGIYSAGTTGLCKIQGPPVYVSLIGPGQVIKIDGTNGAISVVASPSLSPSPLLEGEAIGPDGKLYVCDSLNSRILRMNQDGSRLEVIYDFSRTTSTSCGGAACPTGGEGPSFIAATGDLYFNTRGDVSPEFYSGIWKVPRVAAIPFGGPFPVPVQVLPPAQLLGTQSGEGTAFDQSGNLLVADTFGSRILISSPAYVSASVLIPSTSGVSFPAGIAVNSHGDILVANTAFTLNVTCFSSSGSFQTTYADFTSGGDAPIYMQFDAAGDLFVATNASNGTGKGKLWRVSPAASPPCSAPGIVTLVSDIGAAVGTVPGLEGSSAVGVAIPNLSAPPTPLTSGGQPITGTPITVFSSPTAVEQVTFPPGTVIPPGETMQATASTLTTTDFQNTRTAGSTFFQQNPNSNCIVYPNTPTTSNGTCFVFEDKCFAADGSPTTCPTSPQPNIIVSTTINNLPTTPSSLVPLPTNPGFLTADDNQNDWVNIFTGMVVAQTPAAAAPVVAAALSNTGDPLTIKGRTTGFNSDFVAVDLGPDPSVGAGTFMGFRSPLRPQNGRVFSRGTAIPVKFQVTNASQQFITNVTAKLAVALEGSPPVEEPVSPANGKGIAPNQFLYDAKSNSYEFYLSTAGYPAGSYTLTVFSNSFPAQAVTFTIQ